MEIREQSHVEDEENIGEVRLPAGNRFLVVLCVEKPRDRVSFTPLGDLHLDFGQHATTKSFVSGVPRNGQHRFSSRN